MKDLTPIIEELKKLKVPYKACRDNEVIWCPDIRQQATTGKVIYVDYHRAKDKINLGIKKTDCATSITTISVKTIHEALSILLTFYYNEVEE